MGQGTEQPFSAMAQPFTLEEHKKFMEALDVQSEGVTGKEWERIASYVGGNRTLMEVRRHNFRCL